MTIEEVEAQLRKVMEENPIEIHIDYECGFYIVMYENLFPIVREIPKITPRLWASYPTIGEQR